jgi:competence protein ComGC
MLKDIFVYIRNRNRKTLIYLTSINHTGLVNKAGFSLFEFVIVLVILTTLIAILIPKFTDIQKDAHKISVQMSADSLQSSVNIIHNVWQSQGSIDEVVMINRYGGGIVLVGDSGWPVDVIAAHDSHSSHDSDVQNLAQPLINSLTCRRLWNGLLKDSAPRVNDEADSDVIYLAEFDQQVCRFRYLLNEDDFRIEYDLATGLVSTFFEHY